MISYPGPLPLGYRFEAQRRSEATHEIPISGFDQALRDYRQLLWEIESFISPEGSRDIPAVFSKVKITSHYIHALDSTRIYIIMHENIRAPQLPRQPTGLDVCQPVTHCTGRVSRPHLLRWSDRECGRYASYTYMFLHSSQCKYNVRTLMQYLFSECFMSSTSLFF